MSVKSLFLLLNVLSISLLSAENKNFDTISVKMSINTDFSFRNSLVYHNADRSRLKSIPADIGADSSLVLNTKFGLDTIFIYVGELNNSKRICIFDINRNFDFSDDYVYIVDCTKSMDNLMLPPQTFYYHQLLGKEVVNKVVFIAPVFPYPYKLSDIAIGVRQHYEGAIQINGKKRMIWADEDYSNREVKVNYAIIDSMAKDLAENRLTFKLIFPTKRQLLDDYLVNLIGFNEYSSCLKLQIAPLNMLTKKELEGFDENFYVTNIKGKDIDGKDFNLEKFRGKYVLIDFWGTWCNPCIKLLPHIDEIHKKYKEIEIISIAYETDRKGADRLRDFISEYKMEWTNLCDKDFLSEEKICSLYSVYSFPTIILIDPMGKIIHRGGSSDVYKLDQKLKQIFQRK